MRSVRLDAMLRGRSAHHTRTFRREPHTKTVSQVTAHLAEAVRALPTIDSLTFRISRVAVLGDCFGKRFISDPTDTPDLGGLERFYCDLT